MQNVEPKYYPASFAQQRLWFLEQYESYGGLYNIPAAWRILGTLHVSALERSLHALIERHEALRTTFLVVDDMPMQCIGGAQRLDLSPLDLSTSPEPELRAEELARAESQHEFDLAHGPLIHTALLKLTAQHHVLLVTLHHIISDGWSMGIFARELSTLYAASLSGEEAVLPDLPIQYLDYAQWQRQWLQGDVLQQQLDHWKKVLAGAPATLEMPTDRPRSASLSHKGGSVEFEVSAVLTQRLKFLAEHHQVSLFMLVTAAFKVLLHRHTGQCDLCVGFPIANRQHPDVQELMGFFVNTLVLRTKLDPQQPFSKLLRDVRNGVLDATAFQDLPFEKLVDALRPERSQSHSPLFQVMLGFYDDGDAAPSTNLDLIGATTSVIAHSSRIAKFELTLDLISRGGQLLGEFEYNAELFDPTTIERMAGQYLCLLEAIVGNPEEASGRLPLLPAAERQQLLVGWNDASTGPCRWNGVHQSFEEQVRLNPHAPAVEYDGCSLTYDQLNRRANQLAHCLKAFGIKPNTLVGISVERGFDMIVGLLGILKAGGAYLPLDPQYPKERLAFMLRDSAAPVLITQKHLIGSIPSDNVRVLLLDADWEQIAQYADSDIADDVWREHLAYCIYTSGSTGKPKGVLVPHESVARHVVVSGKIFGHTPSDRTLQFSTICFDQSVEEIFPSLASGGVLVLSPPWIEPSPSGISEAIQKLAISVAHLPVSLWHECVREWGLDVAHHHRNLRSLRHLDVTGDRVIEDVVRQWIDVRPPGVTWTNTYGPTEVTCSTTVFTLYGDDTNFSASIGRPIGDTRVYVLDANLQLAPIGAPGELHIAGNRLATGYLNRPDLTADKFVPDPFGSCGDRMYRTGDIARYRGDGSIEFLGRSDLQVKIRGFRVELAEIEGAILRDERIAEAVVVAQSEEQGDKTLVAYVVPRREDEFHVPESRRRLSDILPAYSIPAAWVVLPRLPVNPNGKIDRTALPRAQVSRAGQGIEYVAPRNQTETDIAAVVAAVLRIERVGIHDNFFDLGGNSLQAAQVIARLCKQFGIVVTLRQFFGTPDVSALAQRVSSSTVAVEATPGPTLGAVARVWSA